MKKITQALVAALLVVGMVAVATGCGDSSSTSSSSTAAPSAATGNATDRAFIAAMIPHHQSAVAMAKVAQQEATGGFVKTLAGDIVRTQTAEIALMRRVDAQLAEAGVSRGDLGMSDHMMGMDMGADDLRGAMPFDEAFMKAMVPHHEGAIAMAEVELAKGENAEIKKLAKAVIAAQRKEVAAMNQQLGGDAGSGMDSMHSGHG